MSSYRKEIQIFILFIIFPALVGNSLYAEQYLFADSSELALNRPAEEYFESFRTNNDFDYIVDIRQAKKEGFWFQIGLALRNSLKKMSLIIVALPFLIQIVIFGLVIFFIIVLLTKTRLNRLFYSEKVISDAGFEVKDPGEDINDFESALQNELLQKQYRKAIRLLYLKLINLLDKTELIKFSKEKTNIDYLKELTGSEYRLSFLKLTGIYNTVWYGLYDISEQQYQNYEEDFFHFYTRIDEKE